MKVTTVGLLGIAAVLVGAGQSFMSGRPSEEIATWTAVCHGDLGTYTLDSVTYMNFGESPGSIYAEDSEGSVYFLHSTDCMTVPAIDALGKVLEEDSDA